MDLSLYILYATLAASALVVAQVVRRYDLHMREPVWALAITTLLGACGMYAAGAVQRWIIHAVNDAGHLFTNTLLAWTAGTTEELAKFAVVGAMTLIARRSFDEAMDGLIYGAFAGLGAALEEAVHVLGPDAHGGVLPLQEPVRLAGHLVMGGIGGFGWGVLVVRHRRWPLWLGGALAGAIVLHTLWDIVAFAAADHHRAHRSLLAWHSYSPIFLMLAGLVAFRGLVAAGARMDAAVAVRAGPVVTP